MSDSTATKIPVALLRKYDRPGPRYTSYPTAPIWSEAVGAAKYTGALKRASSRSDQPLALYCHIPFCKQRCFYCGCTTCVTNNMDSVATYVDRLLTEIVCVADSLGDRTQVSQLHFGGGTPTFLDIDGLGRILDGLEKRFSFRSGCERSIEIDPRVTTEEQLEYLAGRGFNRISLGVQDFDEAVQRAIGRIQPIELVARILEVGRRLAFRGINFDLIYGLPKQSVESFTTTLDEVIHLRPDRLAVYSFAYLPTVRANQSKIDERDLPTAEVKYQLFSAAVEKFTAAGYRQIGMDHFALPDDELSLAQIDGRLHRNFMGYTVQSAPEMIGFGMSSIGYVADAFFQNQAKLDSYKDAVADSGWAVYRGMQLSREDLIRQYVITSLMCNFRLDYARFAERFGKSYRDHFVSEHSQLAEFVADGLLVEDEHGLTITELGRTFVRNIAMAYDAYLTESSPGKKVTFSRTI